MKDKNLLLFGCDFFPSRKTSEINFWNDMVEEFRKNLDTVVILSINNRQVDKEILAENVLLYNVKPLYMGNSRNWTDPEYTGSAFHKLPLAVVYKTFTFLSYVPFCKSLIAEYNIDIFHYFRVFGLANEKLIKRFPEVLFSITVPTHIDRGFPFHRAYHFIKNRALKPVDKVIPTSYATRDRLEKLGIEGKKLAVIPWSLKSSEKRSDTQNNSLPSKNIPFMESEILILWSGPLQHTSEEEFQFALDVAKKVVQESSNFKFIFAFKPDKLKQKYLEAAAGIEKIAIIETDRSTFLSLMKSIDILLSPVCNPNRTVAPPLTWIEFMRNGIPVISTDVSGVEELINHQKNGFIVNGVEETARLILSLTEDQIEAAAENARITTSQQYDIASISKLYLSMWDGALREKRSKTETKL